MAKYECPFMVGEMVTFIEPPENEKNTRPGWNDIMTSLVGHTATVIDIRWEGDGYFIKCDNARWTWKDSWLQRTYTLF